MVGVSLALLTIQDESTKEDTMDPDIQALLEAVSNMVMNMDDMIHGRGGRQFHDNSSAQLHAARGKIKSALSDLTLAATIRPHEGR